MAAAEPSGGNPGMFTDYPHARSVDQRLPRVRPSIIANALRTGDLLISRLGNGVGNAATVHEARGAVFAGYLLRFRAKSDVAEPDFLGYQLQSNAWRQHVAGFR